MLKFLHIFFLLFFCNSSLIFAQKINFQRIYYVDKFDPNGINSALYFYDIELLKDGSMVGLGFITDKNNQTKGIMAFLNTSGDILWAYDLGPTLTSNNTRFGSVEASNGDIVISFSLSNAFNKATTLCARLSNTGNIIWLKRIGTDSEFCRDITGTQDGGFVLAGSSGKYGTDAFTWDDIYLLKIDGSGNTLWTKTFGNPSAYDQAFAVTEDHAGNLIMTGRCINRGTFMAFIAKTDANGNNDHIKVFGEENQSTNGYDIAINANNEIFITGYTTILEGSFQDRPDAFVIKTDANLNPIFTRVFDPIIGVDWGSLGEGIILLQDGGIVICSETGSFTNHDPGGPHSAGKMCIMTLDANGGKQNGYIYNTFGSQYPRIKSSVDGGYVMAGFSTAYALNRAFQGLILKLDENFQNGSCQVIDVTDEYEVVAPSFIVEDWTYIQKSGGNSFNLITLNPICLKDSTICSTIPPFNPSFTLLDKICLYQSLDLHSTGNEVPGVKYNWWLNDTLVGNTKDVKISFDKLGKNYVTLEMSVGCLSKSVTDTIIVDTAIINSLEVIKCKGDSFKLNEFTYTTSGEYILVKKETGKCDETTNLKITFNDPEIIMLNKTCKSYVDTLGIRFDKAGTFLDTSLCKSFEVVDSLCENCIKIPNAFTPGNNDQMNDVFQVFNGCKYNLEQYHMQIYNRWGEKVFESTSEDNNWDGRYKGALAPVETYVYIFQFYNSLMQKTEKYKGVFSLLK